MDLSQFDRQGLYFFESPTWSPNGCGSSVAFVFFITYTITVSFVILNLFIAVIFEGFEESEKSVMDDAIQSCIDIWKRYDPDQTMAISADKVFDYIDEAVEALCMHFEKVNP